MVIASVKETTKRKVYQDSFKRFPYSYRLPALNRYDFHIVQYQPQDEEDPSFILSLQYPLNRVPEYHQFIGWLHDQKKLIPLYAKGEQCFWSTKDKKVAFENSPEKDSHCLILHIHNNLAFTKMVLEELVRISHSAPKEVPFLLFD